MKYPVKITQVLEGYVDIEANSLEEALKKADIMYNQEGRELPDMEDGTPLTFSDPNEVKVYEDLLTQFIRHEVPFRFENLLETEVPDEVIAAVIRELQDNVDVMFAHERFDSWLLAQYRKFSADLGSGKEADAQIKVLVVEPGKEPYVKEIGSDLRSLQKAVGGYIEAVYPCREPVAIICNEDAKLEGLPLNRALRDQDGDIYDIVAGTFIVVGVGEEDFISLSDEHIQQFAQRFKTPEQFMKQNGKIVAIPIGLETQQGAQNVEMNMDTHGLHVAGHTGTWHTIDHVEVDGHTFWLMAPDHSADKTPCIIVDERGKLCLSGAYDGLNEHTVDLLHQEVMPVDRMPDPSITVDEMKDYGYAWGGMLPMREEVAAEVMKSCSVFRLYEDDTESMVLFPYELKSHAEQGGIFGVEKIEWKHVLERQQSLANKVRDAQHRGGFSHTYLKGVTIRDLSPEDREKFPGINLDHLLDAPCGKLVECGDMYCAISASDYENYGKERLTEVVYSEYSEVMDEHLLRVDFAKIANDEAFNKPVEIPVKFVVNVPGSNESVFKGVDNGKFYIRLDVPTQSYAQWLTAVKHGGAWEDQASVRANVTFAMGDEKEKVTFNNWNGAGVYAETYNPAFSRENLTVIRAEQKPRGNGLQHEKWGSEAR